MVTNTNSPRPPPPPSSNLIKLDAFASLHGSQVSLEAGFQFHLVFSSFNCTFFVFPHFWLIFRDMGFKISTFLNSDLLKMGFIITDLWNRLWGNRLSENQNSGSWRPWFWPTLSPSHMHDVSSMQQAPSTLCPRWTEVIGVPNLSLRLHLANVQLGCLVFTAH